MALVERYCPGCKAPCLSTALVCATCGVSLKVTRPLADSVNDLMSSLQLTHHLQANQLFKGRYQIVRQVGVGGFGAVYEAEDTLEKRQVAIKEIGLAGLTPQQMIEATGSFHHEAELLSRLNHPSIPRMHEQLRDAEHWYLVMDFIAGETLESHLARADGGRLPLKQVLRIGIHLCRVLQYLHSRQPQIIFRDVKPANILLTPEEKLYLIDFGVARQYQPGKSRDTIAFGSPGYAAPEQYGKAQTTPRADIYSLGAMLHQMLTGQDPSFNLFHFQPLRTYNRTLPVELENLVGQMLETDRERRPASMDAVSQQLQAIASALTVVRRRKTKTSGASPTLSNPFSTIGVTVSLYREHRAPIKALAWSRDGRFIASWDNEQRLYIWNAFQAQSVSPWLFPNGQAYALTWSSDGQVLAVSSEGHSVRLWSLDAPPHWWQTLETVLDLRSQMYKGHSGVVNVLAWSPDGQRIASADVKGTVHVWDTLTLERLLIYLGHSHMIEDIAWSPSGQWIALASTDHTVRIWKAADGKKRWDWHLPPPTIIHTLTWSPDGRYLACGSSNGSVYIRNIEQNRQEYIYLGHKEAISSVAWSPDGQRIASASVDGLVQVWDALDGKEAFTYSRHENSVLTVAWSPDGQHLASAGQDTEVHVWKTT